MSGQPEDESETTPPPPAEEVPERVAEHVTAARRKAGGK